MRYGQDEFPNTATRSCVCGVLCGTAAAKALMDRDDMDAEQVRTTIWGTDLTHVTQVESDPSMQRRLQLSVFDTCIKPMRGSSTHV